MGRPALRWHKRAAGFPGVYIVWLEWQPPPVTQKEPSRGLAAETNTTKVPSKYQELMMVMFWFPRYVFNIGSVIMARFTGLFDKQRSNKTITKTRLPTPIGIIGFSKYLHTMSDIYSMHLCTISNTNKDIYDNTRRTLRPCSQRYFHIGTYHSPSGHFIHIDFYNSLEVKP